METPPENQNQSKLGLTADAGTGDGKKQSLNHDDTKIRNLKSK